MTAGSGIIHQEMPKGDPPAACMAFSSGQIFPSSLKMTAPRYQEVKAVDIPEITDDDGTHVRVVCGSFWGKKGPVDGIAADPIYLDVSVPPGKEVPSRRNHRHAFAYVFAGAGKFCNASGPLAVPTEAVDGRTRTLRRRPITARWCSSIAATKSPCRPAMRASASCWSPASRSKSRSPGTAPSS